MRSGTIPVGRKKDALPSRGVTRMYPPAQYRLIVNWSWAVAAESVEPAGAEPTLLSDATAEDEESCPAAVAGDEDD